MLGDGIAWTLALNISHLSPGVSSSSAKQKKKKKSNKHIYRTKEELKLSLIIENMMIYAENLMALRKTLLYLIFEFSTFVRYKTNINYISIF